MRRTVRHGAPPRAACRLLARGVSDETIVVCSVRRRADSGGRERLPFVLSSRVAARERVDERQASCRGCTQGARAKEKIFYECAMEDEEEERTRPFRQMHTQCRIQVHELSERASSRR
jgi:hypothetical protein